PSSASAFCPPASLSRGTPLAASPAGAAATAPPAVPYRIGLQRLRCDQLPKLLRRKAFASNMKQPARALLSSKPAAYKADHPPLSVNHPKRRPMGEGVAASQELTPARKRRRISSPLDVPSSLGARGVRAAFA